LGRPGVKLKIEYMKTYLKYIYLFLIVLFGENILKGQNISCHTGFFLNHIEQTEYSVNTDYGFKFGLSVNLYLRNILIEEKKYSFGLSFSYFRVDSKSEHQKTSSNSTSDGTINQLAGLLVNQRFRLMGKNHKSYLILNSSVGFMGKTSKYKNGYNYCDSFLCDLPDFCFVVIPGLEYLVKLKKDLALQILMQYYIIPVVENIRPFSSLLTFQIGLGFSFKPHE